MKLSSKSLTAIKMFVDLGEHYQDGYISLIDIAKRKDISKKFLEQIVILYKKSNLLIGSRGNQGGYRLSKSPNLISLKDIIEVSENSLFEPQSDGTFIKEILSKVDQNMSIYFESIKLSSLVEKQIASYSNNYCI